MSNVIPLHPDKIPFAEVILSGEIEIRPGIKVLVEDLPLDLTMIELERIANTLHNVILDYVERHGYEGHNL